MYIHIMLSFMDPFKRTFAAGEYLLLNSSTHIHNIHDPAHQ
jgi:hypothetical protein